MVSVRSPEDVTDWTSLSQMCVSERVVCYCQTSSFSTLHFLLRGRLMAQELQVLWPGFVATKWPGVKNTQEEKERENREMCNQHARPQKHSNPLPDGPYS